MSQTNSNPASESDFLVQAEAMLKIIEELADASPHDVDAQRSGNVLSLEYANGNKLIVNLQVPMQEIWLAAKDGAYHYRYDPSLHEWLDTRTGAALLTELQERLG